MLFNPNTCCIHLKSIFTKMSLIFEHIKFILFIMNNNYDVIYVAVCFFLLFELRAELSIVTVVALAKFSPNE